MKPSLSSAVCALFCIATLAATTTNAGKGPRYRYGETWWQEYDSDADTELLLHFGAPTATARQQLLQGVEQRRQDETLGVDLKELDDEGSGGGLEIPALTPDSFKPGPVDDAKVPAGTVLDYSDRRRRLALPGGMGIVPAGRFGMGLRCDGGEGLALQMRAPVSAECSFRVSEYPKAEACIFSVANDESRLLLLPDGRLELRLKKPHGNPGTDPNRKTPMSDPERESILRKDATIVSPEPVPLGKWVHVAIWNQPHPTPGGGEPWDARLKVDGFDVAWHLSERYNDYAYLGRGTVAFVLGNSADKAAGFRGDIDEVRASTGQRDFYERPPLPWRDADLSRPLQFDKPFFLMDGTLWHASLDRGLTYDLNKTGAPAIALDLKGESVEGMAVPGIRGRGWVIDPSLAFPRFPLDGLSALEGALEFWLRPVNWDDVTGYWHHSPPVVPTQLSVARFYGLDVRTGKTNVFANVQLPRCHDNERARIPVDPGHWMHCVAVWRSNDLARAHLYINGKWTARLPRAEAGLLPHLRPLYVEFGVSDDVTVVRGETPRIEIDELVGYGYAVSEFEQARRRWMGALEPYKTFEEKVDYRFSLGRLDFSVKPLLPGETRPVGLRVSLLDTDHDGRVVRGPLDVLFKDGSFDARLNNGEALPYGSYAFAFQATNREGKVVIEGRHAWQFKEDAWRNYSGGILDAVPPPWTPIKVEGPTLATRMTLTTLGADGLPAQIRADGVDLLAGPFRMLEGGKPMTARMSGPVVSTGLAADWSARFQGSACDVQMQCHAEYDGMVRYVLTILPKARLAPIAFEIPLRAAQARRYLFYPMGARGVSTGTVPESDGRMLTSRAPAAPWREFKALHAKDPAVTWERFSADYIDARRDYGFFGHVDINDMNRGLFWFCDNAAGWHQSRELGAVELARQGDVVRLTLNLVAEPVDYTSACPIVFAVLPHPAKPYAEKYRLLERAAPDNEPLDCSAFDAFRPWPMDPRAHSMQVYPAADPRHPEAGASWDYAASCIPSMKANKPVGYRTLYLSKAWFSCRTGAVDGWEWRSGESGAVSLTPHFVNYLAWEMNEWIGRGIWNAIYLDECYEGQLRNLDAGFSVTLPDGSEQPGTDNFQFRELMKRWRNLFHAHGQPPMLLAHHTYSWQYPGLLYADACLDGENAPIVSLKSRDWIASTSKERFEVIQNSRLWGMASFYMPFIAEGGFDDKERSAFPRWQWRMARQAQSQFAHYEVATTYAGQGSQVYAAFWNDLLGWGGGDSKVEFHPYWDNAELVAVPGQGGDVLVSIYCKAGAVLLIGSNRGEKEALARITLQRGKLGLSAKASVRELDSSYAPPAGADYVPEDAAVEVGNALAQSMSEIADEPATDAGVESGDVDALLLDDTQLAGRETARLAPRFVADGTLVLPIRPRDFRMVAIE